MRFWSRTMLVLIALPLCVGGRSQEPEKQTGRRFALLVGVTKYDKLEVNELVGPANDVLLMRDLLKERFNFVDNDIVILADGAQASGRPTRANIKSQFDRLAKDGKPGDQIVVLFSGHGAQQPEQVRFDKPDGLDEILLPCDAGLANATTHAVPNAIVDYEIDAWSKAIAKTGASQWLIFDSCHSGSILRGGGDYTARRLHEGTLVPIAALNAARKRAAARKQTTPGGSTTPAVKAENKPPRRIALYACQGGEETLELTAPPDGNVRHGLLTYTVCEVLREAKTTLTHRELTQRIQGKYLSEWFRTSPTPLIDARRQDADTEVLGNKTWRGRSQFILTKNADVWTIRAGQLQGLTQNSILAVYPPAGSADADKLIGHVRIRSCTPISSNLEPCAFGKTPAPQQLQEGGRCVPVFVDYGPMRLRVGIEGAGKDEGDTQRRARQIVQEMAKAPDSLIALVENRRAVHAVVRVEEQAFYVLAADVAQVPGKPPPGAAAFGPFSADQTAVMKKYLTEMARARNLLKLIAKGEAAAASGLEVEMLKFKDAKDPTGETLGAGPQGIVLQPGEWVQWRIKNGTTRPLDVTLLFINNQFGIEAVFPQRGQGGSGVNRLQPHASYPSPRFEVPAKSVGRQHMVAIAVNADGPPLDFTCLAQPTLAKAGEVTRGQQAQPLHTPLGRLLKGALYGADASSSPGMPLTADAPLFRLMSWTVPPPTPNKSDDGKN